MDPRGRRGAAPLVAGGLVTVAFTAVLLGRSLGWGLLLYRDFVSVPAPVLGARTWGWEGSAPRAVPLDAVTVLLHPVVSSGAQQQLMLVVTLLLSGLGVTVLLRGHGVVATSVGAALATWSPYAAERLLLGQPPTLLAWSALPWLVLAVRSRTSGWRRLVCIAAAAAPAALTPYGGLTAAVVVMGLLVLRRQRGPSDTTRDDWAAAGLAVLWCLPWLVPAVAGRTDAGQASGAEAFRLEANGPRGVIDVLGGGGVWSSAAALGSREHAPALLVTLMVVVLAFVGLRCVRRRRIALVALLGPPVLGLLLATGPGLAVFGWAQQVPGVAMFRDTHRLLGLSWFATTVLAGLGAAAVARRLAGREPGLLAGPRLRATAVAVGLAIVGGAAAPLSAPDAPGRLSAAYGPVVFPAGWRCVVAAVGDRPTLLLPWQPMRQTGWARGQVFLDPLPLALSGAVVSARDLTVERDGESVTVGDSDPPEAAAWRVGVLDASALRHMGIERVVEWRGTPGALPGRHDGLELLVDDDAFAVWAVPAAPGVPAGMTLPVATTCARSIGRYDTQQ